jgi:hypothetical protein
MARFPVLNLVNLKNFNMQPVTINITNLIGTMIIIGDKENASAQIQGTVSDALMKVLKQATEAANKNGSNAKER